MESINDKERAALKLFREQMSDIFQNLGAYEKHDLSLLRWLRARELNVDKAEEMYRKAHKWRQENKIDSILQTWKAPPIFAKELPLKVTGVDKAGCVICLQPYGKWDLRGVVEKGHGTDYVHFWTQFLEQGTAFMKKESQGKKDPITQFVLIYDLQGFSMRQIVSREKITAELNVMRIFEQSYPETLKVAYVINAPKIFELLFAFFKPILTGHTVSKIKIFGSNSQEWRQALLEDIDPDELPSDYGGTNTSCINYTVDMGLDWLPRGVTLQEDTFKQLFIPPGQKVTVDLNVEKPDTRISWNFKTQDYDIGFQFLALGTQLFNCQRADSHIFTQKGTHMASKPGKYTLVFDNSFSKFRGKQLSYAWEFQTGNQF